MNNRFVLVYVNKVKRNNYKGLNKEAKTNNLSLQKENQKNKNRAHLKMNLVSILLAVIFSVQRWTIRNLYSISNDKKQNWNF